MEGYYAQRAGLGLIVAEGYTDYPPLKA